MLLAGNWVAHPSRRERRTSHAFAPARRRARARRAGRPVRAGGLPCPDRSSVPGRGSGRPVRRSPSARRPTGAAARVRPGGRPSATAAAFRAPVRRREGPGGAGPVSRSREREVRGGTRRIRRVSRDAPHRVRGPVAAGRAVPGASPVVRGAAAPAASRAWSGGGRPCRPGREPSGPGVTRPPHRIRRVSRDAPHPAHGRGRGGPCRPGREARRRAGAGADRAGPERATRAAVAPRVRRHRADVRRRRHVQPARRRVRESPGAPWSEAVSPVRPATAAPPARTARRRPPPGSSPPAAPSTGAAPCPA
ncbi:hypothetical protein SAMN05444921_101246 [Streptomyces wuyuanensis]|uniref:Uncharacterized protein n=1 Tax=Streptomyces wuyuanensis TaxID=1196353 RepID=A0A1G9MRU7_9ACTN|nr:hypothetical protein SAMN05444921_101246 [Streptomyces wuyuanensis]